MAEENGLYDKPTERVGSAMSGISVLVSHPVFHWTAGILIGFAVGVWLDTWLRKFYHQNDSLISASEWRPEGLHVSWMTVNAKRLYTDYYIEIAVHGFNATGASISIGDATGNMRFRGTIDTPAENGMEMPVPKVLHDRTPTKEVANLTQIFLVVEQRVPRDIVERIRTQMDAGKRVRLDINSVMIRVVQDETKGKYTCLPMWNSVSLHQSADQISMTPVYEAQGGLTMPKK